ncbi:hypothetical protein JANAI62_17890 [Jannaschia pagri]|uniref:Biotin-(Acetyl-CoA carboxylase) ligase n=1 Tax=Jannaschia pagri TaxID=2829797 RepID=A0ABQ4NL71_9RHOB|nr:MULTISPECIES: biotin/lipoate--protein ligase family protein [unclassified Jannaschia]GIT91333.1 hypothetical protein JANAI61_17910 [Jannaschia sp. AI_61]GIT95166.1 hypothetical protein JANAI62_17890 [Jannaschia sp. AI_62]
MTAAALTFPPLMQGEAVQGDVLEQAAMRAAGGCDAGLILHDLRDDRMAAAMVFAPDVPLAEAVTMLPLCGVGFQNALGALAPPEVAVHLDWDGGLRINGASCGSLTMRASGGDPTQVPDWLVVALTLPLWPQGDGGETPDQTALYAEGCADVAPPTLLEAWARHTLNWITRWEADGARPLHAEWRGLAHGIGEETVRSGHTGTYLGVDDRFGMLLRDAETTHLIPLTTLLEAP